jgi:hypothetical protein
MNPITKHIPSLDALNDYYRAKEREKHTKIKLSKVKSLKVESYKIAGRKVEDRVDEIGRPYQVVISQGAKVKTFNTNNYTQLLQKFFEFAYGFKCRRISSEGRYRPDKYGSGKWIPGLNSGIEDLQVYLPDGRMVAVEVKSPTDRQSAKQKERQAVLGRYYLIATANWEAFTYELVSLIGPPTNELTYE